MVLRSSVDAALQKQFDSWYSAKGYTIPTLSESRKTKSLNWDAKRTAKCWKFFVQGAMEDDGRPMVQCVVCGDLLFHGGFFGPTPMTAHLKKSKHIKRAKELVLGSATEEGEPTEEQILLYLKEIGNEGLRVRILYTCLIIVDRVCANIEHLGLTEQKYSINGSSSSFLRSVFMDSVFASWAFISIDTTECAFKQGVSPCFLYLTT